MGNTRGNTYSRNHTYLDPDNDAKFWQFDWDIAAQHDLPSAFQYVKNVTGQDKITYISHSMGATEMLVLLSEKPEYNDYLDQIFLLAPVAYLGHVTGSMATFAPFIDTLESALGAIELFPDMKWTSWLGHDVCADNEDSAIYGPLCKLVATKQIDVSPGQLNYTMLPVYMDNWPEGGSSLPVYHYAQVRQVIFT